MKRKVERKMSIIIFKNRISIISSATAAGKKESEGPLGEIFDSIDKTDRFGEKTWEKCSDCSKNTLVRNRLGAL